MIIRDLYMEMLPVSIC